MSAPDSHCSAHDEPRGFVANNTSNKGNFAQYSHQSRSGLQDWCRRAPALELPIRECGRLARQSAGSALGDVVGAVVVIGRQHGIPANLAGGLLVDREPEGVAALGIDVEGAEGDGVAGLGLDVAIGVAAGDQSSVVRVPVTIGSSPNQPRSSSPALLK